MDVEIAYYHASSTLAYRIQVVHHQAAPALEPGGRGAENLIERGFAFDGFRHSIGEQGTHAEGDGEAGHLFIGVAFQEVLDEPGIAGEDLEQADPSLVAGATTPIAADGRIERRPIGDAVAAHFRKGTHFLQECGGLLRSGGGLAVRAEAANKALGDDTAH